MSREPVNPVAHRLFWKEEKRRFQLFRNQFETFVNYYESGKKDLDSLLFLRENNSLRFRPNLHIYDPDIDWCTSHDRLVRDYLAFKKYEEFIGLRKEK